MSIREYSLKRDGCIKISSNFQVSEFACKDGTDMVLIDDDLVALLQKIRDHFMSPVTVHSGYRTKAHNLSVGGSAKSYHVKGMAADVKVAGIPPVLAAVFAQDTLKAPGIGLYAYESDASGFVHIDTRPGVWRGLSVKSGNGGESIAAFFPILRAGSASKAVTLLQRLLKTHCTGLYDEATRNAVIDFQRRSGLTQDGIAGPKTWGSAIGIIRS